MDWQTVVARRARRRRRRKGGWNIFFTTTVTVDARQPGQQLLRQRRLRQGLVRLAVRSGDGKAALRLHRARATRTSARRSALADLRPHDGPGRLRRRSASTRPSAPTARTASRAGSPARCRCGGTSPRRIDAPSRRERASVPFLGRLTPPGRAALPASARPLRRRACRATPWCGSRWRRCPRCPGRHWPAPSRRPTRPGG